MIRRDNSISMALGVIGLAMHLAGNLIATFHGEQVSGFMAIVCFPIFLFVYAMLSLDEPARVLSRVEIPIVMIGSFLMIAAFVYYAKAKGRSGLVRTLWCLVFPLGLLLFAVLKDESREP